MYEAGSKRTVVSRAREASGLTQVKAAEALGLGRATLNTYEHGGVVPSERKTWDLLSGLALGQRSAGEVRPRLFVSFGLAGQRFLAVDGALVEFEQIANVNWFADQLDSCQLERVLVVPGWDSFVAAVCEANADRLGGRSQVVVFERLGRPAEDVLEESLRELIVQAGPWLSEAFARRAEA